MKTGSGMLSSSRKSESASSITASKAGVRCEIERIERPLPLKSKTASAAFLITTSGKTEGTALKLCFTIVLINRLKKLVLCVCLKIFNQSLIASANIHHLPFATDKPRFRARPAPLLSALEIRCN